MGRPRADLTGQTFGRLAALAYVGNDKNGKALWLCRCECGTQTTVPAGALKSGNTISCGCKKWTRSELTRAQKIQRVAKGDTEALAQALAEACISKGLTLQEAQEALAKYWPEAKATFDL